MAASLLVGMEERDSAKKRRQDEYRQDLQLQMRERLAAKQRERLQDMSVNASGWLDPEKRPERLRPLGGVHWTEQRGRRNERVRPYHTLFMYDRVPRWSGEWPASRPARYALAPDVIDGHYLVSGRETAPIRTPPGLRYQPLTQAGAGVVPSGGVDQAYSYMGARDLAYGPRGGGSLVQPITLPYPDNRPIIIHGGGGGGGPPPTRTVVEYRDDGTSQELRRLLGLVQSEKDRMRRDQDDFQRRLQRDLEDEKRRLHDQEEDARRRMERMRREAEESRKEAERQRREAERLRREAMTRPKSAIPASPKTKLYYDMDDYRRRLMEERKKFDDLLKATDKPRARDVWDVHVLKKPRYHLSLPPTPSSADRANRDNVRAFNDLKFRDYDNRDEFRRLYMDVPLTNRRLEEQQEALLQHQRNYEVQQGFYTDRPREKRTTLEIVPRRSVSRPAWLDRTPTPFAHVQKKWNKKYGVGDGKKDTSPRNPDKLKLRSHRPYSTETLADDTWIHPSETAVV